MTPKRPLLFIGPADPGPVGSGSVWKDTSGSPNVTVCRRNFANTGWELIAAYEFNTPEYMKPPEEQHGSSG